MKKIFVFISAIMLMSTTADAQKYTRGSSITLVGWEIGIPLGTTADFISETSFSGMHIDYRQFMKPNLSVGLSMSFSSFAEYVSDKTYENNDKTQAIHTDMQRITYSLPILANVHYYFKEGGKVVPYAGLGMGAQYVDQIVFLNSFEIYDRNWGFVVRPGAGVIVNFNPNFGGHLGMVYNMATNDNDMFDQTSFQYLGFHIGFAFTTE